MTKMNVNKIYENPWLKAYRLSSREIDVLACLLENQASKRISIVLDIKQKTVDAHIVHIMQKLGKHGRSSIIEFVKKSSCSKEIRKHYFGLVEDFEFKETIQKIKKNVQFQNVICKVICKDAELKQQIKSDLKKLNILCFDRKKEARIIVVDRHDNYHKIFFEILDQLYPHPFVQETAEAFKVHFFDHTEISSGNRQPIQTESVLQEKKHIKVLILTVFMIVGLAGFGLFHFGSFQAVEPARSELKLPDVSVLLKRSDLIQQLEQRLSSKTKGISTVALVGVVGMGGVGKTTISRLWGRLWGDKYPHASVWEIHAETPTTLIRSFGELAKALAKTPEQKKELSSIDYIQQQDEKEKQRLAFVQARLKELPNWLLIYDNVESLKDIFDYLPQDTHIWGQGRVIITTRNTHIKQADIINPDNIITLDTLSEQEALTLFTRIRFQKEPEQLSSKERAKARAFLKHIPLFPHDVTIAARYIANHHLSYESYLSSLEQQNKEFYGTQEDLLQETSEYTKTRYNIITLSLNQIMKINKAFTEFLLMISLINSQQIPKEMLERHYEKIIANCFVHELKKYSLITEESAPDTFSTFSLHRSTQDICRSYLMHTLHLSEKHHMVGEISTTLESYMNMLINEQNGNVVKIMIPHCESFLTHQITQPAWDAIKIVLGGAYYESGNDTKSIPLLTETLNKLEQQANQNDIRIARASAYLGVVEMRYGRFGPTQTLLERSIPIYRVSQDHLGYGRALVFLGHLYMLIDQYPQSEEMLNQSVSLGKKYANNSAILARALVFQGMLYREWGNYQKAKALTEQSVCLYKTGLPYAWGLGYLASIENEMGHYEKARTIFEQSHDLYKKNFAANHVSLVWILPSLSSVYRKCGRYEEAKQLCEQAIYIYKKSESEKGVNLNGPFPLVHLGKVYRKLGCYPQAQSLLEEAKIEHLKIYGENNIRTIWTNIALGQLYTDLGQHEKAKQLLEPSLRYYQKLLPTDHPKIGKLLARLGAVYLALGNTIKAKELLEQGLIIVEKHFSKDHIQTAAVLRELGAVYLAQHDMKKAEELIQKSLRVFEASKHPDAYLCLENLATLYHQQAIEAQKQDDKDLSETHKKQANSCLHKALKIAQEHFPKNSAHIKRIFEDCLTKNIRPQVGCSY